VVDLASFKAALDAGAGFIVSPGTPPRLAEALAASPVPVLPGCATASEAMALMEHGFRAVKFFPAEAAGGASYLSSLGGPLGDLRFCPTGGITPEKARTYLALANVVCVGGSWMMPKAALAAGDYATVERLAREAAALKAA
jgi:2-dehydro-3-deoxyphosphogluconate aldolase / (4S)-4-hydroxy-2-oxoglutarate aldolase